MSEKNNILYLCVLMALSDFDLQKEEVHKIIKISEELKIPIKENKKNYSKIGLYIKLLIN